MALSEYEKQVLAQMEEELRQGDPDLASKMTSASSSGIPAAQGSVSLKRMVAGGSLAVVGLLVLVGAVSLGYSVWSILVGVVAFALMVGGILIALSPAPKQRQQKRSTGRSDRGSGQKTNVSSWQSFIADQERRWDERRQSD